MKQTQLFDRKIITEEEISRAQNLLYLLMQGGGTVKADLESDRIIVSPVDLAMRFANQIRASKPAILQLFHEANEMWERGSHE